MKKTTTTKPKKLKLVYKFNGKFHHRAQDDKLLYIGGETRLLSVDEPASLTYSKLHSMISERVMYNEFKLNYLLPGHNTESVDSPLIRLSNDDDVTTMVEEFESYYNGVESNGFGRIWMYVIRKDQGNEGNLVKFGEKKSDFGCGFKVLTKNIVDSFKGHHGFKKLTNDNLKINHNHNNNLGDGKRIHGKKSSNNEQDLRKVVLKQQLMLARQCDQMQDIAVGDYLGIDGKVRNSDFKHNQLLIDLGNQEWEKSNVVSDQNSGGFPVFEVKSQELQLQSCVKDSGLQRSYGGLSEQVQCLNREEVNVVPTSEGYKGLNSYVPNVNQFTGTCFHMGYEMMSSQCGVCNQIGTELSGKPNLSPVRCDPVLEADSVVSNQGQGVMMPNTVSPLPQFKANCEAQAGLLAVESQILHQVAQFEEYCANANASNTEQVFFCKDMSQANGNNIGLTDITTKEDENAEFIMWKNQTDSNPTADVTATSWSLSSYNPSQTSSKMENPAVSDKVSETLQLVQQKLPGSIVKATKQGGDTEKPSRISDDYVKVIVNNWDKSCCTLQQDTQDDTQDDTPASIDVDEKVVIRQSLKYSNMLDGVPDDLVDFYTQLATKGLQNIRQSDLEYVKELGSGNYGTVYHGKWRGSDVAIKKMKPNCFNGNVKEDDRLVADFWKEAHMLAQLHHPNIVSFYGVVTDGPITNLATVTEYMRNGSLKQVLQRKDRTIDWRKRIIIAMDAAFGMEYLHEKNIVHFDLKSHNFLVNIRDSQRPVCKIGDLGLSKIKRRTMVSGGIRGTIPWMAPELLNASSKLVTEKVDVYSFGIVMWELLTGEEPYADMRSGEIIAGIIKGTLRPEIPSWCDPLWRSLMERCWSSDPNSRPNFTEIALELRAMSTVLNMK